jgi:hypothetical protein
MAIFPHWLYHLNQLAGTPLTLLVDALRYVGLCLRSPTALAAENLFLRKQLALYRERHVRPRRATQANGQRSLPTMPLAFSSMTAIVSSLTSLTSMCNIWG